MDFQLHVARRSTISTTPSSLAEYRLVEGSHGIRRAYSLTVGLREGYGPEAQTHSLEEAIEVSIEWMKSRAASGQAFLTGTFSAGEVVYAWPEGPGKAAGAHEPTATFSGEVSVLYSAHLADEDVAAMLDELAVRLGSACGQTRVYVAYRDEIWVVQQVETVTPTGETV